MVDLWIFQFELYHLHQLDKVQMKVVSGSSYTVCSYQWTKSNRFPNKRTELKSK